MTSEAGESWRLFVAIPVPEDVKATIRRTQAAIRQRISGEGIRWTRPDQFHLTLKFLGDIPSASISILGDALLATAVGFSPLPLAARGLGFFPGARAPRVIWAGIKDPGDQLADLHRGLERACVRFRTEAPESDFHAHVTLARIKRPLPGLPDVLDAWQCQDFGTWTATHAELIRSHLSGNGPTYTTLAKLPLSRA
jgi:2'-5' RNA ligase